MNANTDIPIRVVGNKPSSDSGLLQGGLRAILYEILAMLENLAAYGETGQIDLRSLPLAPGEYENLKAALGKGEAEIRLELDGLTVCRETAYPSVWWVQHDDALGARKAEFIEVAHVPEILVPDAAQLRDGIARLEGALGGSPNRGVA